MLQNTLRCMILFAFIISHAVAHSNDSIYYWNQPGKSGIEGFFSTSLIINRNWKEETNSGLLLATDIRIRSSDSCSSKRITQTRVELAYYKYLDSIWVKYTDRFCFSNIWQFNRRKIKQTFSFTLISQLTDTWIEKSNGINIDRKWKSGPLLPASIVTGYGFIYKPLYRNYINISFPAYKIGSLTSTSRDDLKIISQKPNYLIYHGYGMSIQTNFEIKPVKNIIFQNSSLIMLSKAYKNYFSIDMSNAISWLPIKHLKFRFEQKFLYDELVSEKIQIRYDFLIGISVTK